MSKLLLVQRTNREQGMTMTPEDVIRFAQEKGVRMVDFKFTDVPGTWQHFSVAGTRP